LELGVLEVSDTNSSSCHLPLTVGGFPPCDSKEFDPKFGISLIGEELTDG
jgi:hypothetical protein